MLALPLSFVGAFLALFISRIAFDMTAMIGIILLMGLVTKNSILLVDFTNRLRAQGKSRERGIAYGGADSNAADSDDDTFVDPGHVACGARLGSRRSFRAPMAIAVIGGLITSTLLTLIWYWWHTAFWIL